MTLTKKLINRINIVLSDESKTFLESDEMFYDTVKNCMIELNLEDADIADKLPISLSTVTRWRNQKSAPLYMMRKPVYNFFLKKLETKNASI